MRFLFIQKKKYLIKQIKFRIVFGVRYMTKTIYTFVLILNFLSAQAFWYVGKPVRLKERVFSLFETLLIL